jgi:hypothetical protein
MCTVHYTYITRVLNVSPLHVCVYNLPRCQTVYRGTAEGWQFMMMIVSMEFLTPQVQSLKTPNAFSECCSKYICSLHKFTCHMYVCPCQKMFLRSCILVHVSFSSPVSGFSGGRGVPVQITRRAIGAGRAFIHVAQPVPVAKCPCNNIKTLKKKG